MASATPRATPTREALARTLDHLHLLGGSASRAELTARVGCERSVMGYLLGELSTQGLVTIDQSSKHRKGDRGRPSHTVDIAAAAPVVVAAQLNADSASVATVALGGRILGTEQTPLPEGRSVSDVVVKLCELITTQAAGGRRLLGICLAVPSPVRRDDGYVFAALPLRWPGLPLRTLILDRLAAQPQFAGVTLVVGNDANLAALAECRRGAGRGSKQMLYLTTGRVGLGGALISDRRLFSGAHGYAMEPGHITVNAVGAPCPCGSSGCLEVEADHRGLLRVAGEPSVAVGDVIRRVDDLLARAGEGDPSAQTAVQTVNAHIGNGLASLINLTDPDCIVLGDTLGRLFELDPEPILQRLETRSFLNPAGAIPVRVGELPNAVLLGAAELAFQPLLEDPKQAVAEIDARNSSEGNPGGVGPTRAVTT